jgi:hypothetical protein
MLETARRWIETSQRHDGAAAIASYFLLAHRSNRLERIRQEYLFKLLLAVTFRSRTWLTVPSGPRRPDGSGQLGIDDQRHAELLSELREIRHQTDSIPKKWELYLVAYVILGAVGAIFILRDIIVWLFLH